MSKDTRPRGERISKEHFVREWAERNSCNLNDARRYLSNFENMIIEIMAMDKEVHFSFGALGGATIPPRERKVFGKKITIPEKTGQPYYRPSKLAKE